MMEATARSITTIHNRPQHSYGPIRPGTGEVAHVS